MDRTPERSSRAEGVTFALPPTENRSPRRSQRVKKNPSVTPKRFTKFFTPRHRNVQRAARASRKALQELSSARLNSRADTVSQLQLPSHDDADRPAKKRRLSFSSIASIPSSPIKRAEKHDQSYLNPQHDDPCIETDNDDDDFGDDCHDEDQHDIPRIYPPRILPYRTISSSASILSKQLGGRTAVGETNDSRLWEHDTAHFYSSPGDVCNYSGTLPASAALPFCVASFNNTPLVAVADEDGNVRIHNAWDEVRNKGYVKFPTVIKTWRAHDNAIMDLEISSDDKLIASASGDQTSHIYNIDRGVSVYNLLGHTGSVKRIQFQPGSGNQILASCSRDGTVCMWDLRSPQIEGPTLMTKMSRLEREIWSQTKQISPENEITEAHTSFDKYKKSRGKRQSGTVAGRAEFAITTCTFISESRAHLLATASENDAIIKLWDMRTSFTQTNRPTPVSITQEPASHAQHRQFGVTSIAMSSDSSRLYSACRDHTIYAYSTSHLVLGGAPEMSACSTARSKPLKTSRPGLGPLYGFRHPDLRVATFYDKLAVRSSQLEQHTENGNSAEMIAIGSGQECAVVFPTNERYLNKASQQSSPLESRSNPRLTRLSSMSDRVAGKVSVAEEDMDDFPIYHHGTALVGGHTKEVTAVAWANNGNLITVADDYTSRCWRWNPEKARALRLNTDRDMARHNSGWAAVRPEFDDDDDDV
ncbi:hypothetical protein PV10_04661 [Exophiala mesophila]|uniref:Uncharacterized protein n=1 Tax=Exophiala mesophila TaxID=212818 RepID=A0A0D2A360_EXOME|nr:uncharacterized protein PV10_04661 [Exophiala mesophila]KIV93448.1 hypothetical protein PV10_04661 [Exophiala mesophila]